MTESEEWRPVVRFDGYEVSNLGRVRGVDRVITRSTGVTQRVAGRLLTGTPTQFGHIRVRMQLAGSYRTAESVHCLVAEAFIGPRPPGMEVCHNDGDPTNNAVSNLRYDTHRANILDSVKHGNHAQTRKTHCPRGHLLAMPNLAMNKWKRTGRRYCLACQRVSCARRGTQLSDLEMQQITDGRYADIMLAANIYAAEVLAGLREEIVNRAQRGDCTNSEGEIWDEAIALVEAAQQRLTDRGQGGGSDG